MRIPYPLDEWAEQPLIRYNRTSTLLSYEAFDFHDPCLARHYSR